MSAIAVRELRQNASEVLREVEAGETVTVTVTVTVVGQPEAKIVPLFENNWVSWERANLIFSSPTDPEWDAARRELLT
jgi:prevent-host-death family protein